MTAQLPSTNPISALNILDNPLLFPPTLRQATPVIPDLGPLSNPALASPSILLVTGAPRNVTKAELASLYAPLAHVLTVS